MKHILVVGLVTVFLLLTEEARSSNLGHRRNNFGDYNLNYNSEEEEPASFYQGKDSTFKYSPQEETITKILKSFGTCQARHPLSSEELAALKNQVTDVQFSHEAKCFIACMFKATDLIKDGRLVTENLIEYFNDDSTRVANTREIIEYCKREVSENEPDLCEYVFKMTKCWTKKILDP